ncbi:TetR/AcrR family transcriptional regulator C-terminal domain-containing protein [Filomicrobium sp.]|uniref:TetR/AcrR family transcriptional regulator C-terminal domain-containing protein n=1 Tax=Filomicrobium sp. TaxID=2024831 RepID=UPI00258510EB|nr:TetR/AcrR family transcriptional regulator C-terminal domain-containing protein [Filomicrobium sp.]MCV0369724.1 TetR/AcrR family transcriptional regulator C-terminal domain-containing protein [Filomicrobium sp.]
MQPLGNIGDIGDYLRAYAARQLLVVLTPRLMQLRRLVIGEAGRFPELGQALYEGRAARAIAALAAEFEQFVERGWLVLEDAHSAATHFNWLVMGEPVNKAMLLGDEAIPSPAALRQHAADAVRVFLAAYAPRRPK